MEIVVKRIAKKKTYTIGHLYILSDKDVKRTWRSGVKIGDKRIFEHSFDMAKLDKEHYFCDTLEPTWRNLLGVELKPEQPKFAENVFLAGDAATGASLVVRAMAGGRKAAADIDHYLVK